ncbi:hypothetical protein COF46_05475 [Bacillus pseudomycoides]|uniref:Uncharacterized protein n=1 Tax=Bacillus pseudomycoides TaxID=64104 RepID=A0AAJ2DMU5_9BACI|nr:hypothetical protein [Bacillus pseudomycoides]MDR4329664.1 hypothetical protein [Bacillus pseudomycoides]PDZ12576.1 hypothetical protein CON70_05475 [Bacillus pseudomycoides]PEP63517.1 hypothetical protein CN564_04320 [Bacillus pseudomycoides]PGD69473.1 hypothetical protein COM46_29595 [Bacillus pseudomycoides]PHC96854.1 hypothetical protein COF36_05125 [Bacillus pseudomycoides]
MNKKVKILKYTMVILACIAIFGTVLPNALDPNETLAGEISIVTFGIVGTYLLFSIMYFIVKKAILRG